MKLYEQKNPYRRFELPGNPFRLVLEPEKLHEIAYQREANRVYNYFFRNPNTSAVVWVDPRATIDDDIAFYSFLFRTFLLAPEAMWFVFDVTGSALRVRRSLAGFQAVVQRIFIENAPRIFYSYLIDKLNEFKQAGTLDNSLPSFDTDKLIQEAVDTGGESLGEILFYAPETPEEPGEEASDEEKAVYEEKKKEIKQRLIEKDELRSFFRKVIENDNLGPAAKTAMKTTVEQGFELGMTSFIPSNASKDLIGMLRLISRAYSRIICFFTGVGDIPFLDEDELFEYKSTVAEQDRLIRSHGNVAYVLRANEKAMAGDLVAGLEEIEVVMFPELLKEEKEDAGWFKGVALYLLGAFPEVDSALLDEVEEAAEKAYQAAEGELRYGLKLLEKAFEKKAVEPDTALAEFIKVGV